LKKQLDEFKVEECGNLGASISIFNDIKNELKSSFIKVIEEDDRITNSKFCDCLKFKNYLKSIKKQLRKHRMAEYNSFNLKITNLISDAKSKCRADCGKDIKK